MRRCPSNTFDTTRFQQPVEESMSRTIEITVSPKGEVTVQTKGYAGAGCQEASRFLEQSLGQNLRDTKTAEYYQPAVIEQRVSE
jgi:hypothetical protein